jgi:DNA polymerase I-like protein with 3'-5' exonuclease and polymerase domains
MLRTLRAASKAKRAIAVDTETTGLRMYLTDKVRGISLAVNTEDGMQSWYVPVSYPDTRNFEIGPIVSLLNEHRGVQVYHNAVGVDWRGIQALDPSFVIPGPERYHDTQVFDWLQDENVDHRLKEGPAARYFGLEDAMAEKEHIKALTKGRGVMEFYRELRAQEEWRHRPAAEAKAEAQRLAEASKKDWHSFTAEDLKDYAKRDAELTLMVMDAQVGPHGSNDPALLRELRLQGVLHRMMATGIRVDPDAVLAQGAEAQARMQELGRQFEGINLNSTPQLRKLIYEDWGLTPKHFTKNGDPSTSREALEELAGHPGIRELMEYRRLLKAWGAYYKPLYETIAADGRIHPSFSSTRTVTGRLSCSDPNLMTIPRGDTLHGVRDVFVPDPGYELWEYDLAQAELRVQASFSGDEDLMAALERGEDLHARTATMIWGPDFQPIQRRLAKNLNYGFSYGIGPRKFATYMVAGTPDPVTECDYWGWKRWMPSKRPRQCHSCHVCQAARILDDYRRAMPKLVQLMAGLERIAKDQGYLPLHVEGRYRHFRSPGVLVPYYTALNAIVQGAVAEFMKDMMLNAEAGLAELGARLCLQVHDSLVIEVLPGTGPLVQKFLQQVADDLNPFTMRMLFDASPWSEHD